MDKIDSFIIRVEERNGSKGFTFIITEDDVEERYTPIIVDYIDGLVRTLNTNYPEYNFKWEEAHRIKPKDLKDEISWQKLILSLGW